jgi:hypothetical protein
MAQLEAGIHTENDEFMQNLNIFDNVHKEYVPIFLVALLKLCNNISPIQVKSESLLF